jgi:hypothetical protein
MRLGYSQTNRDYSRRWVQFPLVPVAYVSSLESHPDSSISPTSVSDDDLESALDTIFACNNPDQLLAMAREVIATLDSDRARAIADKKVLFWWEFFILSLTKLPKLFREKNGGNNQEAAIKAMAAIHVVSLEFPAPKQFSTILGILSRWKIHFAISPIN